MKVEQKGTGFAPITITLETKEEADLMWASLNVSSVDKVRDSDNKLTGENLAKTNTQMWATFDKVYPTGW